MLYDKIDTGKAIGETASISTAKTENAGMKNATQAYSYQSHKAIAAYKVQTYNRKSSDAPHLRSV